MPLSFSFNHHGFWLISMRSFIYIVYISTLTNVYDITLQWVYVCNYLVEEQTQYTYIISKHKFINLKLTIKTTLPIYVWKLTKNGVLYYWWRHCLISKEFETTQIQKTINYKFDAKKIFYKGRSPLVSYSDIFYKN